VCALLVPNPEEPCLDRWELLLLLLFALRRSIH
jgi:hypothetical protein